MKNCNDIKYHAWIEMGSTVLCQVCFCKDTEETNQDSPHTLKKSIYNTCEENKEINKKRWAQIKG